MCDEYADMIPLAGSGELSEQEEHRLREHLSVCPSCRHEAELLQLVPALIGKPPEEGWCADVVGAVHTRLASGLASSRPISGGYGYANDEDVTRPAAVKTLAQLVGGNELPGGRA